jgi:hypothetical protein
MHGFVALEAGQGFGIPLDLDESYARLVATLDHGLSASPRPRYGAARATSC